MLPKKIKIGCYIRAEMVKCGKPKCQRCPHGPYYYGYKRVGGKLKKTYLGKTDPRKENNNLPPAVGSGEYQLDAIFDRATASLEIARRILGVTKRCSAAGMKKRFLSLTKKALAEKTQRTHEFRRVLAAWEVLGRYYGVLNNKR